jgi:hypothetical protein
MAEAFLLAPNGAISHHSAGGTGAGVGELVDKTETKRRQATRGGG